MRKVGHHIAEPSPATPTEHRVRNLLIQRGQHRPHLGGREAVLAPLPVQGQWFPSCPCTGPGQMTSKPDIGPGPFLTGAVIVLHTAGSVSAPGPPRDTAPRFSAPGD